MGDKMSLFLSKNRIREYLQNLVDEFLFKKIVIDQIDISILSDDELKKLILELQTFLIDKTNINIQLKLAEIDSESKIENNQILRTINRFKVIYLIG